MLSIHSTSIAVIGTIQLQPARRPQVTWTPAESPVPIASLVPQVLARYGIVDGAPKPAAAEMGLHFDARG